MAELDGIPFSEIAKRAPAKIYKRWYQERYAVLHLRNRLKQLYEELPEY